MTTEIETGLIASVKEAHLTAHSLKYLSESATRIFTGTTDPKIAEALGTALEGIREALVHATNAYELEVETLEKYVKGAEDK